MCTAENLEKKLEKEKKIWKRKPPEERIKKKKDDFGFEVLSSFFSIITRACPCVSGSYCIRQPAFFHATLSGKRFSPTDTVLNEPSVSDC